MGPHMLSMLIPGRRHSKVMREFEFGRDEVVLTEDDATRRLFAHIAPDVRRDMIGWLRLTPPQAIFVEGEADRETWSSLLGDVLEGASLVLDQSPERVYSFFDNDRDALAADWRAVSVDWSRVCDVIRLMRDRDASERAAERPAPRERKVATG